MTIAEYNDMIFTMRSIVSMADVKWRLEDRFGGVESDAVKKMVANAVALIDSYVEDEKETLKKLL